MILQLRILKGLRTHFSQLRIAKELRIWTRARALHYKVAVSPDQKQDYPSPVPCPAACSSRFLGWESEPELGRDALTRACLAQLTLRSAYHVQMKCPHCRVEFHDDPRQLSYSQMLWITG